MIITILGIWLIGALFVFLVSKLVCPEVMPSNFAAIGICLIVWPLLLPDAVSDIFKLIIKLLRK